MPRSGRVCTEPGCPVVLSDGKGRCAQHRREVEAKRGSFHERYGSEHRTLRRRWAALVARGGVRCWRCGEAIEAGGAFDLGHHDDGGYAGPEHPACNRSAAGLAAHGLPPLAVTHSDIRVEVVTQGEGGDPC